MKEFNKEEVKILLGLLNEKREDLQLEFNACCTSGTEKDKFNANKKVSAIKDLIKNLFIELYDITIKERDYNDWTVSQGMK